MTVDLTHYQFLILKCMFSERISKVKSLQERYGYSSDSINSQLQDYQDIYNLFDKDDE